MSAPKAFILHLERAAGRRANVETLRARLPIESEILPAVDGARLSAEEAKAAYVRSRFAPRYPFALGLPEIGAFLSHRAAWRRIVDEGLDFACVFEDDAEIDQDGSPPFSISQSPNAADGTTCFCRRRVWSRRALTLSAGANSRCLGPILRR